MPSFKKTATYDKDSFKALMSKKQEQQPNEFKRNILSGSWIRTHHFPS